jgi:hypothetical protein
MADRYSSTAVYLLPGMTATIKALRRFIRHEPLSVIDATGATVTKELIRGFYVFDEDVGDIKAVDGQPAVVYTHKKFAPNKIVFTASTGEVGVVDVISVPIHDHASIVTGGPAYGTYFADDETTETT